jgi:hypothetical protein
VTEAGPVCVGPTTDSNGVQCSAGPCLAGGCRVIVPYGAKEQTASPSAPTFDIDPRTGDNELGELAGVQIQITEPGWVVQLSMLTAEGGAQGYLGLYDDDGGGQPGKRIVATGLFTANGDPALPNGNPGGSAHPQLTQEPVTPTLVSPGYYWILGVWQTELAFEVPAGTLSCDSGQCVNWYFVDSTFGPLPAMLQPKQSLQLAPKPILYAEVAE